MCGEAGGIQDQIAASFGGLNRIDMNRDGYTVRPIVLSNYRKNELNSNLMLFFTGFTRFSADIQKSAESSLKDKTDMLLKMKSLVDDAEQILTSKTDIREFGRLLDDSWRLKSRLSVSVSTNAIDLLYDKALQAGAIGGKLLGAGGGGFLLFFVEKEKQQAVRRALSDLLYVPFLFENTGTQVIHYTAEDYELDE